MEEEKQLKLIEISLQNFRNYSYYNKIFKHKNILFHGANGVGKTNILEAISLLSPGSGIKAATTREMCRTVSSNAANHSSNSSRPRINTICDIVFNNDNNSNNKIDNIESNIDKSNTSASWGASFKFANSENFNNINISFASARKLIKVDNKLLKNSLQLLNLLKIFWVTPKINYIFQQEKYIRQKFFDKIISIFYPEHLKSLIMYERFKKERQKILFFANSILEHRTSRAINNNAINAMLINNNDMDMDNIPNDSQHNWLNIIEEKLTIECLKITRNRLAILASLQNNIEASGNINIKVSFQLNCPTLALISEEDITSIMNLKKKLFSQRGADKYRNKTLFGCHLADFEVFYNNHLRMNRNIPAKFCSTGEQKSILLAITLAVAEKVDILLFDDISASLDEEHFHNFISKILNQKCQIFFTDLNYKRFKKYPQALENIELL